MNKILYPSVFGRKVLLVEKSDNLVVVYHCQPNLVTAAEQYWLVGEGSGRARTNVFPYQER